MGNQGKRQLIEIYISVVFHLLALVSKDIIMRDQSHSTDDPAVAFFRLIIWVFTTLGAVKYGIHLQRKIKATTLLFFSLILAWGGIVAAGMMMMGYVLFHQDVMDFLSQLEPPLARALAIAVFSYFVDPWWVISWYINVIVLTGIRSRVPITDHERLDLL